MRHAIPARCAGLGIAENTVLVGIEGHRLAMSLYILARRLHIGEGALAFDHLEVHQLAGRVVNIDQQSTLWAAVFEPPMF